MEDKNNNDANTIICAGLGLGTFSGISLATIGSVCPLCIIATPTLIGYGIYKKHKTTKNNTNPDSST